jgi:uncharacterized membrane protein YoaK (UPF0700 family)
MSYKLFHQFCAQHGTGNVEMDSINVIKVKNKIMKNKAIPITGFGGP